MRASSGGLVFSPCGCHAILKRIKSISMPSACRKPSHGRIPTLSASGGSASRRKAPQPCSWLDVGSYNFDAHPFQHAHQPQDFRIECIGSSVPPAERHHCPAAGWKLVHEILIGAPTTHHAHQLQDFHFECVMWQRLPLQGTAAMQLAECWS